RQRPVPVASLRPRGAGGAVTRTHPAPATGPSASAPAPDPEPVPGFAPLGADRAAPGAGRGPASGPGSTSASGASVTELPRRVRQASLVPQLREVPEPKAPPGSTRPEEPPGRSPEEARDRMAAYRDGWARGSRENSPHAGSEGEV
ncbi:histidine kinase, partial [Streptomyces sp. Isolate_45]|nr:histidine kinase [Streptomyces sp. Isolate_45]